MKKSYFEKLKNPRWQKKRLKVMERDDWSCRECHRSDVTLNVHHRFYRRGAAPWEYQMDWLETLCEDCHEHREKAIESLHDSLLNCSTGELQLWAKRVRREIAAPKEAVKMTAISVDQRPVDVAVGKSFFARIREELNA